MTFINQVLQFAIFRFICNVMSLNFCFTMPESDARINRLEFELTNSKP